ncbi:hypothetical protein L204_105081 [Cryptococcus depauperatus]|nr:hypothetical protein L204_03730 [Cryptococcus depauperatus CBS 7855]
MALSPCSPTLSEMEYEQLETPTITLSSGVTSAKVTPPVATSPVPPVMSKPKIRLRVMKKMPKRHGITRYLVPIKEESFIGPLLSSSQETISLLQRECPSLSSVSPSKIALYLRFDGSTQDAVKDVLFKVLPSAWPEAVSEVLPLIHVKIQSEQDVSTQKQVSDRNSNIVNKDNCHICSLQSNNSACSGGTQISSTAATQGTEAKSDSPVNELTWNDLKENQMPLGITGWRDEAAIGPDFRRGLLD